MVEKHHGKCWKSSHALAQRSSPGLFSPLQPERCRIAALRVLLLTLHPNKAVGCWQGGWAGSCYGDRCPKQGVAGRGKLCGGTTTRCQLPAGRDSFWGENCGEQMVRHPTRESRSHPFPVPPTETSKFPELIDYQGRISILLDYNLVLMHVFTLYLFHVGN